MTTFAFDDQDSPTGGFLNAKVVIFWSLS